METQKLLETEIGNKETTILGPKEVKIAKVDIEEVGEKNTKKVVCTVIHPDREDPIKISSVKYENKGKLQSTGLWVNLDDDNKIRKGSSLAIFMEKYEVKILNELHGKIIDTTEDEKGYLTFKAY